MSRGLPLCTPLSGHHATLVTMVTGRHANHTMLLVSWGPHRIESFHGIWNSPGDTRNHARMLAKLTHGNRALEETPNRTHSQDKEPDVVDCPYHHTSLMQSSGSHHEALETESPPKSPKQRWGGTPKANLSYYYRIITMDIMCLYVSPIATWKTTLGRMDISISFHMQWLVPRHQFD
jgi:hypothetical protein